jgi:cell division protein FtsL
MGVSKGEIVMAAYIHGNLAVEQKSSQRVKMKETRKVVTRSKSLPVQEKLLYLFTVIVCVLVAGVIIWRYAQIYEMNTRIQQIEKNIKLLEAENSALKHKVEELSGPDRMLEEAKKRGMSLADGKNVARFPSVAPPKPDAKTQSAQSAQSNSSNVALNGTP